MIIDIYVKTELFFYFFKYRNGYIYNIGIISSFNRVVLMFFESSAVNCLKIGKEGRSKAISNKWKPNFPMPENLFFLEK